MFTNNPQLLRKQRTPAEAAQSGQGIVEYILILALLALVTITGIAISGGGAREAIDKVIEGIGGDQPSATEEATPTPGGDVSDQLPMVVSPVSETGESIPGVDIHVFDSLGNYIDRTAASGADGQVSFEGFPNGAYAFRADYQAHEFWSPVIGFPGQTYVEIDTGLRPVTVQVVDAAGNPLPDIEIHAFNGAQQFTGVSGTTGAAGTSEIDLVDGSFKVRADYRGQPYWSQVFTTPEQTSVTIEIPEAPYTVRVVDRKNKPVENVPVYAFNENESYTGIQGTTDADGQVTLDLPNGRYKFRADYEGVDYWSEVVSAPGSGSTTIEVGEPPVRVRVINQTGGGIEGVTVYAFRGNGNHYTGDSAVTDSDGYATFDLKNGTYSFRADYKNFTYWSDSLTVPKESQAVIKVGEGPIDVRVVDRGNQPVTDGVYVYAFSLVGKGAKAYYLADIQELSDNGIATFDLPQGEYRFLAFAWSNQDRFRDPYVWSDTISKPPTFNVTIRMR